MIQLNNDILLREINLIRKRVNIFINNYIKVINISKKKNKNDRIVIVGPWLGELGVALIRWIPCLRYYKSVNLNVYIIINGYKNHFCLYRDFADEYWVIPDFYSKIFLNKETSYNYGVFHYLMGNNKFVEHAVRHYYNVNFNAHDNLNLIILENIAKLKKTPCYIISELEEIGRNFYYYEPTPKSIETAEMILQNKGIKISERKVVCFLPRMRILQPERSWSFTFYKELLEKLDGLSNEFLVVLMGSALHEFKLISLSNEFKNIVSTIGEDNELDLQLTFWRKAKFAMGPPSGGLVLAYILGVPLVHWYKPDHIPLRKGIPWNEIAEPDYTCIRGIKSSWLDVTDDSNGIIKVLDSFSKIINK